MRTSVAAHPALSYSLLAFILTWAWWIPMVIAGAQTAPGIGWPTHLPGLLGPALAALTVTAIGEGRSGVRELIARVLRWNVPRRWYVLVAATLVLIGLAPLSAAISGDPLPAAADYGTYSGVGPLPYLLVVLYVVLVNGFGEEIGWRGYLAERLIPRLGPLRAAMVVAPVWALWHLPMFWVVLSFKDFGLAGAFGWMLGLTAGSIVLTWLYASAGHSILIVALWHTAFNLVTATTAGAGVPAAAASTVVMIAAVLIAIDGVRRHKDRS